MAVPIVPKSEQRKNNNISVGYGELPAVEQPNGQVCWALPDGTIECNPDRAKQAAAGIDRWFRRNISNVRDLMYSRK